MSFDPGAEFRHGGDRGRGWPHASEGLDLLRAAIVGALVTTIIFKLIGAAAGAAGSILEVIASLIFGIMTVAALAKWRTLPSESRARGLADMAWIGSIISLVGTATSIIMLLMAVGGSFRSMRSLQPFLILVVVVSLIGSLLQTVGFLLSARTVALHLDRPDVAGRATATLVLGAGTVILAVLASLGVLGRRDGAMAALVFIALAAIVALVLFLMTISGIQQAIRDRPNVAEAFT